MINHLLRKTKKHLDKFRVKHSFKHIAGPQTCELEDDEAAVVMLVRDAEYYLPLFIDWHQQQGFEKFVIIDNGSIDRTIDIAKAYKNVTLAKSHVDFVVHQNNMRLWAVKLFVSGGWSLMMDSDELFEKPGLGSLRSTLRNFNDQGVTCCLANMLEMFPEHFLDMPSDLAFQSAVDHMTYFDVSDVTFEDYFQPCHRTGWFRGHNTLVNSEVPFLWGGIRRTQFGENPALTKHPLTRNLPNIVPSAHPHVSMPVHIADFTCVLRHYKFTNDFVQRDKVFARRIEDFGVGTQEYAIREKVVQQSGLTEFFGPNSQKYSKPEDLFASGFLTPPLWQMHSEARSRSPKLSNFANSAH